MLNHHTVHQVDQCQQPLVQQLQMHLQASLLSSHTRILALLLVLVLPLPRHLWQSM
jgi:hypothetical protein